MFGLIDLVAAEFSLFLFCFTAKLFFIELNIGYISRYNKDYHYKNSCAVVADIQYTHK